jgi:hypothetical protein
LQTKAEKFKAEVEAEVEEGGAKYKRSRSGAKALSALMVVLLLAEVALSALASVPLPEVQAQQAQQQLPRVALVKLWSVSHAAYMAKFVGEDYVVVFDSHGDVSLDGRFISAYGAAYVYKASTGAQLGSLSGGPATWRVDSWEPFKATKVASVSGFFSADSKRMVADPRVHGGTNAAVYDTSTWSSIPIDWGFTDTTGSHFYAAQLDYYGYTLAVGYIGVDWPNSGWQDASKLLVYRYDPAQNKYVKAYEYSRTGDYGRRLHMTLDGNVIVVGGIGVTYLDVHVFKGGSYSLAYSYTLPDSGGVTALGISDPYKVGYVIAGTLNGYVLIATYNATTNEFRVLFQQKLAPDNSWLYNPFYDRWLPKATEVFALCSHRDSSRAGVGIVYDVLTNNATMINFAAAGTPGWYAAAVSPEAGYVFLGNSLYMVVKRDVQAREPRVRLSGTLRADYHLQPLDKGIALSPPRGLDVIFFSGRVTVSALYTEAVPIDLVTDPDVARGKLSNMAGKGLVSVDVIYAENAEMARHELKRGHDFKDIAAQFGFTDYEHLVADCASINFKPPPYFWEGNMYYGTVVKVPLSQPLRLFTGMTMEMDASVQASTALYDKNKRVLGLLGVPVTIGAGTGASAAAFAKLADWLISNYWFGELELSLSTVRGLTIAQPAAKVAGAVGIAVAVWGGIDAALVEWGGLGEVNAQAWIVIAPTAVSEDGRKFTAVRFYLPFEESSNVQRYYDVVSGYLKKLGYADAGCQVEYVGMTWDDYRRVLERGFAPVVDLYSLLRDTIGTKYGIPVEKLTITGVDVLVVTRLRAKETFWEWFFGLGGVNVASLTLVGAHRIQVKGTLKSGLTTDPSVIASTLGRVYVNDVPFEVKPGAEGAYADFAITLGTKSLAIRFEQPSGYYGEVSVTASVSVKSKFSEIPNYGYTTTIDYEWPNTQVRLSKIEVLDVPRPAVLIERVFKYAYGEFSHDVTKYFSLQTVIDDAQSPTGKLYYYVATDVLLFDPSNGGVLQPGKKYTVNYYYAVPPDVSVRVLLNGTGLTSTLAHHATVVLNNTAPEQDVAYTFNVTVYYLEGLNVKVIDRYGVREVARAPANGEYYKTYDISKFVYEALEYTSATKVPAWVEVYSKIVDAKYDYFKYNDEFRVAFLPLFSIMPAGNYTVTVRVFEYDSKASKFVPSPSATVRIYRGSAKVFEGLTNSTGALEVVLAGGTYTFTTSKKGFTDYNTTVTIVENAVVNLYLYPPLVDRYWLDVRVLWANGKPFSDALAQVYNSTSGALVDERRTDAVGLARFLLPKYNYTLRVYAVNPYNTSQVYDKNFTVSLTKNAEVTVALPWAPPEAVSYRLIVFTYDAMTGEGVANVTVVVRRGGLAWASVTNSTGFAEVWLPYLGWFNVTGVHERYAVIWRTITIVENNTRVNLPLAPIPTNVVPPLNGTAPGPVYVNATPYWWLSVQVLWADGFPFHDANVTVYDSATNALIAKGVTNGTGFVHFLIRNGTGVRYAVYAVNPYNATQTYSASRSFVMTQHYYFAHVLPWTSEYYRPEVAVVLADLAVHRGQGYLYGNVSHCVFYGIFTNKPQTVTVFLGIYNFTDPSAPKLINSKTVTRSLSEGVNLFMDWISVNATGVVPVRALVNVTSYQYDTDPSNNYLWSPTRLFKPFTDFRVFVVWRPVQVKQSWTVLPGDVIEIDIGVEVPVNTTAVPAKFTWTASSKDLKTKAYGVVRGASEDVRAVRKGVVWRNVTVAVPWTSVIVVNATVSHEWDDVAQNNNVTVVIRIDPNIKLSLSKYPTFAREGDECAVVVNLTSNVEAELGAGAWVSVEDNTTNTVLKRVEIAVGPEQTVELRFRAPENPSAFWIVRTPYTTHSLGAVVVGYDSYYPDNYASFTLYVVSNQWIILAIGFLALIILVVAVAKAVRHTMEGAMEERMRFVKRKRPSGPGAPASEGRTGLEHAVAEGAEGTGGAEEGEFVKRKRFVHRKD